MEKINKKSPIYILLRKWLPLIIMIFLIWKVLPVSLAIFAAYFLYPIIKLFHQTLKIPLWLSAILTEVIVILSGIGLIGFATSQIIEIVPEIQKNFEKLNFFVDDSKELFKMILSKLSLFSDRLIEISTTAIQTFTQQMVSFFIFLLALFFALYETGRSRLWFFVYIPLPFRKQLKGMFEESGRLFGTFLSVGIRLFILTLGLLSVGFYLLGFSNPVGAAFLISLADALPFLGIGIFIIPMAIFFIIIKNYFLGIALLILFIFVQLSRQMAESYFWASTFQIRAVHAFIISACSLYLFGLVGILISPFLLLAALKIKNHPLFSSQ